MSAGALPTVTDSTTALRHARKRSRRPARSDSRTPRVERDSYVPGLAPGEPSRTNSAPRYARKAPLPLPACQPRNIRSSWHIIHNTRKKVQERAKGQFEGYYSPKKPVPVRGQFRGPVIAHPSRSLQGLITTRATIVQATLVYCTGLCARRHEWLACGAASSPQPPLSSRAGARDATEA